MPNRSIDIRVYEGRADLELLIDFAGRCMAQRFPLASAWHPGDFAWELKPDYDRPHRVRLWLSPRGVEAVSLFEAAGKMWLEILPDSEDLLPRIVARAEQSTRRAGHPTLSIRTFDHDVRRIAALEALGYRRGEPDGVWLRRDLSLPLPPRAVPAGFAVRDSVGIDPAARARAHRDAWNDLSQIGIADARSTFMEDVYLGLMTAPVYDPALDILIEAEDGTLVANCVAWVDAHSRIGIFEPIGTHAKFRNRGLARVAITEGLHRLRDRGMAFAGIGTAHFNAPAIASYSALFELFDRTHWWTKTLEAGP